MLTRGTTFGGYEVTAHLGAGGMGEVYAARDPRLNRMVALKILASGLSPDHERIARVRREAQSVAALNHPNIVTIHSVEEHDGIPFLTMELVQGKTLAELMEPGGMALDRLLQLALGVTDALVAAHGRGIVHRDIKPANVMVTDDGRVKVLDFGLAKLLETEVGSDSTTVPLDRLTGEGGIVGTIDYMSPEQAEGRPVDHRSDLFSLGVILYQMASGTRPFTGATPISVITSILRDTPVRLTQTRPSCPPALSRIVDRCLEKDPSRRYQDTRDLRHDLEEVQREIATSAERSSSEPAKSRVRTAKRHLAVALALLLGIIGVSGYFGRLGWLGTRATNQFEVTNLSLLTTQGQASIAAVSPDGRYVAHVKTSEGKSGLWMRQTVGTSDVEIVSAADVRFQGVTFSPDGDHIYYVTYPVGGDWGTLFRVAALGGTPQRLLHDVDSGISFAPDGRQFVFVRYVLSKTAAVSHLMIASSDGTDPRSLTALSGPDYFTNITPSWSPDGHHIVASVDVAGKGQQIYSVTSSSGEYYNVPGTWVFLSGTGWMPDGRSFLVTGMEAEGPPGPSQIWEVQIQSGDRRLITNDLSIFSGISISRDGRSLVTVQKAVSSRMSVNTNGTERELTSGRAHDGGEGVAWVSDERLVFTSFRSNLSELWTINIDGKGLQQLAPGVSWPVQVARRVSMGYVICVRWDRTGFRVWRVDLSTGQARPLTPGPHDSGPAVSPDSRWVYFSAGRGGAAWAYRVPIDGGDITSLGTDQQPFYCYDTLADGRILGSTRVVRSDGTTGDALATMNPADGTIQVLPAIPRHLHPISGATLPIRITPDSAEVSYVDVRDGVANVWTRPLEGGLARQVTNFTRGRSTHTRGPMLAPLQFRGARFKMTSY